MGGKNHVTGSVCDNCIGVSCSVVEEFFYFFHCVLGRFGLLGGDGAKCCKHGAVHGSCIIEECSCDLLDEFCVFFSEERGVIWIFCILYFCAIFGFDVGVRLILGFFGFVVVKRLRASMT